MAYWRLFYHFVWTTKDRLPLLTPDMEDNVHRFLHAEANKMHAPLFFIGGTEDHVHILAAVRPAISPAEFVKQLKGSSSRFVSLEFKPFEWQDGYGVFSISESDVPHVMPYVKKQKQHHAAATVVEQWEQTHKWNLGPKADE
jgi:putative transposase